MNIPMSEAKLVDPVVIIEIIVWNPAISVRIALFSAVWNRTKEKAHTFCFLSLTNWEKGC